MGHGVGITVASLFDRGHLVLPGSTSVSDAEVVEQILSYFLRNPNAADSLEAIAHWRLLEECAHRSFQKTEAALHWLVTQGFLLEVWVVGSARIFRMDPGRRTEAVQFLEKQAGPPDQKNP
jgi:hypothetical protein